MYAPYALDLAFVLGTAIVTYRLFIAYRPSITPFFWSFWAGQLTVTGHAGLALSGLIFMALAGLFTVLQAPRQVIEYGPWGGRLATMLNRWQLASLPGSARVINARGLTFEISNLDKDLSGYRHPRRLFYTIWARYEPSTPPPLAARPGQHRMAPEDVSVDWPYLIRTLIFTGVAAVLIGFVLKCILGHIVTAILLLLMLACLWAGVAMCLAGIGVILQDALYEDHDGDHYPSYRY